MASVPLPPAGELARHRAALYHWFALAFYRPPNDQEVLSLRAGMQRSLLAALAATPDAGPGVAAMRRVLDGGAVADTVAKLGTVHARIFEGAGGQAIAPPYRSVYESADQLLCQKASADMDRVLRQHRLRIDPAVHEPPDYLPVQLEAMSQLALRAAEEADLRSRPLRPLQDEQAEFLTTQLLSWVREFAARVAAVDSSGYYAGLASVLVVFLDQDRACLAEG